MTEIHWLNDENLEFPAAENALLEPNGLLAAGGDLEPQRLVQAYLRGIFPWYDETQPILWWSPNPRSVLFPDKLHISKSLRKTLRKHPFSVSFDQAFEQVVDACSQARSYESGTWITREMIEAYCRLHEEGIAHSVEVWQDSQLVGGLYGVALGKVFFGESMFSRSTDASKVGFVYLVKQLNEWGYALIDCQIQSQHLDSFGAQLMARDKFSAILSTAAFVPEKLSKWQLTWRFE